MKINWEHTKLIEKYLDEELSQNERIAFEAELSRDVELRKEVDFHKKIRVDIETYGERSRLKRKMNLWHDDKQTTIQPNRVSKISWRTVSVAASVSLLLMAGTITAYHFINQQHLKNNVGNLVVTAIEENNTRENNITTLLEKKDAEPVLPSTVATSFAISKDGYLLTAFHVVEGKQKLTIEQFGKEHVVYHARVVKVDQLLDIAVLKIDDSTFTGFKEIPFVFTNKPVELANKLYSVGYPLKKELIYSEGSVSGLTGYKGDTVSCQVNIIANPGNSGSPVMNESGELVGVVLSKNVETEGETYMTQTDFLKQFIGEFSSQKAHSSIKLNGRSKLKGQSLTNQVKSISPFIFIVRTGK